jgi:hypothetical protein
MNDFSKFSTRLYEFIAANARRATASGEIESERDFNELALELFTLQFQNVLPYRRFCEAKQRTPQTVHDWREIPAMPATAFKELELTSFSPNERTHVFHSSGTIEQRPSRHIHNPKSLAIYEASLLPGFERNILAGWDLLVEKEIVGPTDKPAFIFLTPSPALAPNSSLVYMFETIRRELGSRDSFFGGRVNNGAWDLDMEQVLFGLRKSMCANRPVAVLGMAFSFIQLLDYFAEHNMRYRLATGSRAMETGGYKGRSREIPRSELHGLITKHLGIPVSQIMCEYGMSELGSQAYAAADKSIFQFPSWCRAQIVSPETGKEVANGETGLLRIFDLANVYSVMAIQTEDLGIRRGEGFEIMGRAKLAEPRGCSLMAV